MTEQRSSATLLLVSATAVALYACFLLFRPYTTPILFASVIAIIFYPLHRITLRKVRNRNVSAALSTLVTVALTIVPLTFLAFAIRNELGTLYQMLATRSADANGMAYLLESAEKIVAWVGRRIPLPAIDVKGILLRSLANASSYVVQFGASLISNAFSFIANSAIAILILFFLFRDGEKGVTTVASILPLAEARRLELQSRISTSIMANFYGGVAVGALQGTLTGLIFWALGLSSPVLWGLVTAVFSVVPIVGSAIVWVPACIVLLVTGHVAKSIILLILGIALIGTIDNIARPLIVHKSIRLHPILIFFSILGGVRVFGILGFFVGPVILSLTAALLLMVKDDLSSSNQLRSFAAPSSANPVPSPDKKP